MKKSNVGFTLIELMIVVAILGVLGSVSLPIYASYVTKGTRLECRSSLVTGLLDQERYYTARNTYLGFSSSDTGVPMKIFSGSDATSSACLISASACSGSSLSACVVLTGTPVKTDSEVGSITIQSDGTKGCSGTDQTKCW